MSRGCEAGRYRGDFVCNSQVVDSDVVLGKVPVDDHQPVILSLSYSDGLRLDDTASEEKTWYLDWVDSEWAFETMRVVEAVVDGLVAKKRSEVEDELSDMCMSEDDRRALVNSTNLKKLGINNEAKQVIDELL